MKTESNKRPQNKIQKDNRYVEYLGNSLFLEQELKVIKLI